MKWRPAAGCTAAALFACVPGVTGPELSAPGAAEAMNAHSVAMKLDTEPELFGWDPSSRANLQRAAPAGEALRPAARRKGAGASTNTTPFLSTGGEKGGRGIEGLQATVTTVTMSDQAPTSSSFLR
jgi:hypothetical protein